MAVKDDVSTEHYAEIVIDSAVLPDVATARGYRTLTGTGPDRDELNELGFKPYVWDRDDSYPGLLIPMHGADGTVRGHQFKPAVPRHRTKTDGTTSPIKYETPAGHPLMLDVPAFTRDRLPDVAVPLWITEGMKKTDALVSQGLAAIGLTGVFNWRNRMGTLGDWEDVPIKGRTMVACFDADAAENRNVQLAMSRLGAWLKTKGAKEVRYIVVPAVVDGTPAKGVDDYFAAGGTPAGLAEVSTLVPPGGGPANAAFTDAFLVEDASQEALDGRFCWASGLGWLKWDGRVWTEVSDVEVVEAVRQWTLSKFEAAASEQGKDPSRDMGSQVQGWRAVLGGSRLRTLASLARGIVQRDAEEFDSDPDLLTVQNGTVHLPTGKLMPFDPAHSITRMAGASYRPDLAHPVWDKALSALPADLHPWFRDRLGQALTGYKTPDHMLVLAYGSGSNGKSTIVNAVRRTLGAYGVVISDRVLMASPDAHPTELMDLRGARYAVLEETPEARHLNVQRLKTTLGTETIKARRIRQDPVEFLATHSLFINSNYRPVVNETDHGTWRRLSLLTYPYTFRKRQEDVSGPWDRLGDPALEYAHENPDVRSAALSWMVQGAKDWYARGRMMLPLPETVENDTRDWRAETDLVMGFADECLTFDREAALPVQDMLRAFNTWTEERGHRPWNDKTFATRFGAHDLIRGARVAQGRTYLDGRRVRVWTGVKLGQSGGNPFDGGATPTEPAPKMPRDGDGTAGTADPLCKKSETLYARHPDSAVPPVPPGVFAAQTSHDGETVRGTAKRDTPERVGDLGQDVRSVVTDEFGQVVRSCWNCNRVTCVGCDPVAVGFDIETASASQLWTGGHEGPFVRLVGATADGPVESVIEPYNHYPPEPFKSFLEVLNSADVIYGHRIFEFDLLALARHCGADYDALAAKAVDTLVLARLADPPVAKGKGTEGKYDLDTVAKKLGHTGKSDDLKALAKEFGEKAGLKGKEAETQGYSLIPVDDPRYVDYLRGDLAATAYVYDEIRPKRLPADMDDPAAAQIAYARREMRVVALQNRMTLNGWKINRPLLERRVRQENEQRENAVAILADDFGLPTHKPDTYRLKAKADWPAGYDIPASQARDWLKEEPDHVVSIGLATCTPGEPHVSPWSTNEGREAIVKAFRDAGAEHYPTTASGVPAMSADALGEGDWYDAKAGKSRPGMLKVYGHIPAVREICELLGQATGATAKYAEIARNVTAEGRVHPEVGAAQASGRWATLRPASSNLGKRGEKVEQREPFVPDRGHVHLTCDLSQVDMRAMAALSQDAAYMELFGFHADGTPRDAHMEMAEVYFEERTKPARQKTKAFNHAGNYGQGVRAVSERTGLPLAVCEKIARTKAEAYPRLAEYITEVRERAASGQLLDNGFGRMMRPDPNRAWTQGPALMGQGAARDIMCESLLRLVEIDPEVTQYLRGVVHDEVILSVPEHHAGYWQQMLKEAFTWEWRGVPILCEVSQPADNWAACYAGE